VLDHRPARCTPRLHPPGGQWRTGIAQRITQAARRIDLQLDRSPHALVRVAEQIPRPLDRAEQVRHHRKVAALDVGIQHGRPAAGINAAMNLGRFQMRVHRIVQAHQMPALR
jgi:hypothetical protein